MSETATVMTAAVVREQFISYFKERANHEFVVSSPVVPHNDPTLLFANAGMNQFKPAFLGQVEPGSALDGVRRAVNSQKCIRAGGKHNDLDDVGKDTYHHTFFEMLGNWSFGDYFKEEAITWAWELLTKVWGIDPDRLYATYFGGNEELGVEPDLEAKEFWKRFLPEDRVLAFGMKDNFWEMGDTGPCGPCSELHFDSRPDAERESLSGRALVNEDHPDVIEIWNLVFIQFDRQPGGLKNLPAKHVDTGMGLERVVRVLQGKRSNYDTDVFGPLFDSIHRITGARAYMPGGDEAVLKDSVNVAYRVVADHLRTLSFAIADGAVPSNEGRGYVLRRVLRRAVRYGRQTLGMERAWIFELVPSLCGIMGDMFPEIVEHSKRIQSVIRDEEESFGRTIARGIEHFDEAAERAEGSVVVSAEDAFRLHDTYGFPVDLTALMADERGMRVDEEGFTRLMEEARERSRAGGKSGGVGTIDLPTDAVESLGTLGVKPTNDALKFTSKMASATVRAIWNGSDFDENVEAVGSAERRVGVVLDKTCFYSEMGGQVSDHGEMRVTREAMAGVGGGAGEFAVEQVKRYGPYVLHVGRMKKGEIRVGDVVELKLDRKRRGAVEANHTATHILNHALRGVLGEGVDQKGSLVGPDRLRFDFSHDAGMSDEELANVEAWVRERVDADLAVEAREVPLGDAQAIDGLRAVFGETYPDPVRVVSVGAPIDEMLAHASDAKWRGYSVEFCGGTHVARTGEIRSFVLVGEEGVSKGVRRIVGFTGEAAAGALAEGERIAGLVKGAEELPDEHLSNQLSTVTAALDGAEIPVSVRASLRERVEALQGRAKQAAKASAARGREQAVESARAIADGATDGDAIVAVLDGAGDDRGALMSAMDSIKKTLPASSVMLLGVNEEEGKIAIVAKVTEDGVSAGLKAGDWVRAASEACGGKGGGRPDSAQGGGTDVSQVRDAVSVARSLAAEKLG